MVFPREDRSAITIRLALSAESRITWVTLLGSAALSVVLLAAYVWFNSQLAFAQFADSFLDVVTAVVLAWTVALSVKPEDEDHHFGHKRAQPVGALVTAVLTGVLAVEVVHRAISALLEGAPVDFDPIILWAFVAKVLFKLAIFVRATRLRTAFQPAMKALAVDARNDVLASSLAVVGYFTARYGAAHLDAWLALPMAALIGWSGFDLAVENVKLLMGEAPPPARQRELMALVRQVPAVRGIGGIRVHYVGTELHAHVEIQVDSLLTVGQAHDIGETVRFALEAEPDVSRCSVHIDPAPAD